MKTYEFDGEKYKAASSHQKEWGKSLISKISLQGNEIILDLGCGDGHLTEQLSLLVPNGKVLGIDASIGMIKTAKQICRDNLDFIHMDINNLHFFNEFNIIFSNAATMITPKMLAPLCKLWYIKHERRTSALTDAQQELPIDGWPD